MCVNHFIRNAHRATVFIQKNLSLISYLAKSVSVQHQRIYILEIRKNCAFRHRNSFLFSEIRLSLERASGSFDDLLCRVDATPNASFQRLPQYQLR